MWYNVRCFNGDEWVIYGIYSHIEGKEYSVDEICDFIYPETVTYMGYSFWLGAEAIEED